MSLTTYMPPTGVTAADFFGKLPSSTPSELEMLITLASKIGQADGEQRFKDLMAAQQRKLERDQFVHADEAIKLMQGCSRFTLSAWRKKGLILGKRIRGQRGGFHYQVGSIEDAVAANSIQGVRKWARTKTKKAA